MSSSEEFASADEDVASADRSRKKAGLRSKNKNESSTKVESEIKIEKKVTETAPGKPPNVEQCWEFESWEDYDNEEKKKDERDGWEAEDDDWNPVTTPTSTTKPPVIPPTDDRPQRKEEDVTKVLDKLSLGQTGQSTGGGWGWKPWGGISSFISTATESVASLTSQVSHGISTAIESGMGVPDPAEMARQDLAEQSIKKQQQQQQNEPADQQASQSAKSGSSLGGFVTGVSQISSKVITGGLDTLEGIGKKTMNMLQENDPGLMSKRKLLGLDGSDKRPVLSQMLREAKEKSEDKERNMQQLQKSLYKKQLHFETLFDDYCGLVHLEALEMLSQQSKLKLESLMVPLSGKALKELQETMVEVQELCELPDQDDEESADGTHSAEDLERRLTAAFDDMETKVDLSDLVEIWRKDLHFLSTDNPRSAQELHDRALHSLAHTTALAVNRMHKLAELLIIQEHHSTVNEADALAQLAIALCWHLGGVAARFGSMLSDEKMFVITDEEDPNGLITSIFLEGTNSTLYIQNAFQLFVPILQLGAA